MYTIDKFSSISFPSLVDTQWSGFPQESLYPTDWAPEVECRFCGDMIQMLAIVSDEDSKHIVANSENCIGLLKCVLYLLFPGAYTWYDLSGFFGVSDYFWFGYSIELGCTRIEELPEWCQNAWIVFRKEGIIRLYSDGTEDNKRYYVWDSERISNEALINVYKRLLSVFTKAIQDYHAEDNDDECVWSIDEMISNTTQTINGLIDKCKHGEHFLNLEIMREF